MIYFSDEQKLNYSTHQLQEIVKDIENKNGHNDLLIYKLMLMVYFDTVDAFERTSRYNRKGKIGLFIEKFNYIKECHRKIMEIKINIIYCLNQLILKAIYMN